MTSTWPVQHKAAGYGVSPRIAGQFRRFASEHAHGTPSVKPVSPHIGFYKSFGRPIAKVFLGAIFTYQATYQLWKKLELDDMKRQKTAEITELESKIRNTLPKM